MASKKKMKFTIEVHPAAALFPMLPTDEMKELASSITQNGLREKIVAIKTKNDVVTVLDGRNRLEALRLCGVDDDTIVSEFVNTITLGNKPYTAEEYVMMANIERRNLSAPQRRALAGKLAIMLAEAQKDKPKEEQKDTLAEAAKKAGVSRRTAASAKKTAMNPSKKGAKAKPKGKAVATPASVLKSLSAARDAISAGSRKWPTEAITEAHGYALAIVNFTNLRLEAEKRKEEEDGPKAS